MLRLAPRMVLLACAAAGLLTDARAQQADGGLRQFTLYFERNSARISPDARRIIDEAAASVQRERASGRLGHVKITGHADATGKAAASERMSVRRAEVVRDALVERGVPRDLVRVEGRGRAEPAVAGSQRSDEPRNRRARIVIYRPGE